MGTDNIEPSPLPLQLLRTFGVLSRTGTLYLDPKIHPLSKVDVMTVYIAES